MNHAESVQGTRGRDEILRVVGFVRAYRDATPAAFSFVLKHQQCGLALGVAVGLGLPWRRAIRPLRFSTSVCPNLPITLNSLQYGRGIGGCHTIASFAIGTAEM
jgi:hypothetical protein